MEDKKMQVTAKRALVPKLRFPEFRDAGEWDKKPLDAIAIFYKGKGISKADIDPQGVTPCIRYGELYTVYGEVISKVVSKTNLPSSELFLSQYNDLLIPSSGETKLDIAKASCVLLDDVALGGDLNVLRTEANGIFLSYLLNGSCKIEIAKKAQGDTVVHLYASQLKLLDVAVPNVPEQQKIADCLTSLDDLIRLEAEKLDAIKAHKKGLMQQLFPAEGETLPKLRFPEFQAASEWIQMPLSKICNILQGYGFPVALQGKTAGKYPFSKVSDISRAVAENGGILVEAANYIDDEDLKKLRVKPIPKGATVFAKIGEALRLNRRAYVQRDCLIDNNATALKAIDGAAKDYFVYLLSQRIDLNKHCGGAVPSVNKSSLEEIEVILPDPDEQERIADCISALDTQITTQAEKIEALKTHKKGLMQQLFPTLDEAGA